MSKQTQTEKRTFRGKVIAVRTFTYEKDGEERTAGELVLSLARSGKAYVTLFGDALGFADGWWLNEKTWKYEPGPVIEVGQWVQAHGAYSEKDWESDKFGTVTQQKLAVFDPDDVKMLAAPKRPGVKPPKAKTRKPRRPKAV